MTKLDRADVPFAPVQTVSEVLDDPQIKHLGTFYQQRHPTEGLLTLIRRPISIDGNRDIQSRPPPTLGEHTHEILRELPDNRENQLMKLLGALVACLAMLSTTIVQAQNWPSSPIRMMCRSGPEGRADILTRSRAYTVWWSARGMRVSRTGRSSHTGWPQSCRRGLSAMRWRVRMSAALRPERHNHPYRARRPVLRLNDRRREHCQTGDECTEQLHH